MSSCIPISSPQSSPLDGGGGMLVTRRARSFLQVGSQPRIFFFPSAPESKPGSGLQFLFLFFFTVSFKKYLFLRMAATVHANMSLHVSEHDFYLFVRMGLNLKHDCITDRRP